MALTTLTLAAVVGGAVLAHRKRRGIRRLWHGQRIAVLGRRGVGKTTLIHFLREGTILDPAQSKRTTVDKYKGAHIKLKDLELKISDGNDVGGEPDNLYSHWENEEMEADRILYLFNVRAVQMNDQDVIAAVKEDLGRFKLHRDTSDLRGRNRAKFVLVGTHADRDPDFPKMKRQNVPATSYSENLITYSEHLMQIDSFKNIHLLTRQLDGVFCAGSLKDKENAEDLLYEVLKRSQGDH